MEHSSAFNIASYLLEQAGLPLAGASQLGRILQRREVRRALAVLQSPEEELEEGIDYGRGHDGAWRESDRGPTLLPCQTGAPIPQGWDPCEDCRYGLLDPRCPHHPQSCDVHPVPCEVDETASVPMYRLPVEGLLVAELRLSHEQALNYAPSLGRGEGDYEGGGRR